jgi:hypothetical protein
MQYINGLKTHIKTPLPVLDAKLHNGSVSWGGPYTL